jgi:Cys-rich four helix bundle protein (predicted Tat secretion target)
MDRREVLLGMSAVAATAALQSALGDEDHSQHTHRAQLYSALASAAADCVKTGQICVDHCLDLFAQGDKSTVACARSVTQLTSICETLQLLATQNSKFLPRYAKLAGEFCKDCEDECRKHEKEHQQCKDCADACASCVKECNKVAT